MLLWVAPQIGSVFLRHVAYVLYGIVIVRFLALDLASQFRTAPAADLPVQDYLRQLVERLIMFGVPIASLGAASWLIGQTPSDKPTVVLRAATASPMFSTGGWRR